MGFGTETPSANHVEHFPKRRQVPAMPAPAAFSDNLALRFAIL
jgi:hypothetical protein